MDASEGRLARLADITRRIPESIADDGSGLALDPELATEVMNRHIHSRIVGDAQAFDDEALARGERVRTVVSKLPSGEFRGFYYPFLDRDDPPSSGVSCASRRTRRA